MIIIKLVNKYYCIITLIDRMFIVYCVLEFVFVLRKMMSFRFPKKWLSLSFIDNVDTKNGYK